MSIERSSTTSSPKPVIGAESHSGKGKVKSGAEVELPAGGGFLALLTSLEPVAEQVDTGAPPLTSEEEPQIALLPTSAPFVPMTPTFPTDLAMLLQQAGQAPGSTLSSFGEETPEGAKGRMHLAAPAIGTDNPEVSIATSAPLAADKPEDFKQTVDSLLDQMSQALPAQSHKARGAELQSGAAASLAESRAVKLSTLMDASVREPALSGALVTSGMGDGLLRQADRTFAKSSVLTSGYGIEGAWGQHTLQAGSRLDAPPVIADPSALSLESMVADTVSYWVTQGVQNAQLTLDGFGGESVEVNISLKGDEAHIGFRTDQPEIRQILEGAVAHLKELLSNEGLVLSGVSVGTSGQDDAGAQEQRNRPDARQAAIVTKDAVPTENLRAVNPSVGRAVDLFV
ncbi:MAG: flagellar hook-length control protein FliK [Gallionella sp.]|nr:flagellar hook-length control protein FliK [Gallionella sp.]